MVLGKKCHSFSLRKEPGDDGRFGGSRGCPRFPSLLLPPQDCPGPVSTLSALQTVARSGLVMRPPAACPSRSQLGWSGGGASRTPHWEGCCSLPRKNRGGEGAGVGSESLLSPFTPPPALPQCHKPLQSFGSARASLNTPFIKENM